MGVCHLINRQIIERSDDLKQIDKDGTFKHHQDEYVSKFAPSSYKKIQAEAPIITQTVRINFYPNSSNMYEPQHDDIGRPVAGTLYDPNVEATLEKVARLVGAYERAMVAIVGHTDSSMKGKVPVQIVTDLSQERAAAVKNALIQKYKFDPNKFVSEGKGWESPADASDPMNHAVNRRVEISVYPPEQGQ